VWTTEAIATRPFASKMAAAHDDSVMAFFLPSCPDALVAKLSRRPNARSQDVRKCQVVRTDRRESQNVNKCYLIHRPRRKNLEIVRVFWNPAFLEFSENALENA